MIINTEQDVGNEPPDFCEDETVEWVYLRKPRNRGVGAGPHGGEKRHP